MRTIDLDSWQHDADPIAVRVGGRRWLIRAPTFDVALAAAEACAPLVDAWNHQTIDTAAYADGLLDVLIRSASFHRAPDRLARWVLRRELRARPLLHRVRAAQALSDAFAASLQQQVDAVTGGTRTQDGNGPSPRPTPSPSRSDGASITSPASSAAVESSGADSGASSARPSGWRPPI